MTLLNQIALISLGLISLLIIAGLFVVIYFFFVWNSKEQLETEIYNLLKEDNLENLIEHFENLTKSNNKLQKYYGYCGLSKVHLKNRDYALAEQFSLEAIKVLPSDLFAYFCLLNVLIRTNEVSKGFYYLYEASDKAYGYDYQYQLSMFAGKLFLLINAYDESIKSFENASSYNKDSPEPDIAIAFTYFLKKENNMSIDFIRKTRNKINTFSEPHSQINEWAKGLLALIHGDFKEGKYIFDYYKDLGSFSPMIDMVLDRINSVYRVES